jgi:hypothetical protein
MQKVGSLRHRSGSFQLALFVLGVVSVAASCSTNDNSGLQSGSGSDSGADSASEGESGTGSSSGGGVTPGTDAPTADSGGSGEASGASSLGAESGSTNDAGGAKEGGTTDAEAGALPYPPRRSPDEVLVVYNAKSPISTAVANDYAQKRMVKNILSVNCADSAVDPNNETIALSDYT